MASGSLMSRFGLATTDLRDQFILPLKIAFILLLSASALASANPPVLNILTQTQRLDPGLVKEFEQTRQSAVRVEFVSSPLEFETRIRSLPHSWDLVLADEQRLVALGLSKVLRVLPETVAIPANLSGLERRARANEDGRMFINLAADPMGFMFLSKSKSNPEPVAWDWIVQPTHNPLWRSRVALFDDERLNLMAAAVATGVKVPLEQDSDALKIKQWLQRAELQGRAVSFNELVPHFLAEKQVVGLVWQSDFLNAQRYIKGLAFAVPASGTYVERLGIGLVADSRNEELAVDFIKFIYDRRDQLAQRRGLLPLQTQDFQGSPVKNWRIFSDDISRVKELSASVAKARREKEKRAGRN
ncbi:MAG: hypothetical protein RIR26_458 [Pseudomonadota bacterium]